jgi:protein TonB
VHVLFIVGFLSLRHVTATPAPPKPIEVAIIDAPANAEEAPPMAPPPMQEVVYSLPMPDAVSFEVETITAPAVANESVSAPVSQSVVPPMVESVAYVRAPAPVYPRESSRRREFGTVLLRVLVDPAGRPAQIQVERSSGYERLDLAARSAVEKALFRPHEVNGVAQAAQVLIPIEFTRRSS